MQIHITVSEESKGSSDPLAELEAGLRQITSETIESAQAELEKPGSAKQRLSNFISHAFGRKAQVETNEQNTYEVRQAEIAGW